MKKPFIITLLTLMLVITSCGNSRTYTVEGVIEELNTCQNAEDLKDMLNDPDFIKWLVDQPQSDQNRIEERMDYNFVRLQLGVDGIIKELNKANSISDLYRTYDYYNDMWIGYQPWDDQKKIVEALFDKVFKIPSDANELLSGRATFIISQRINYCTTLEEVNYLIENVDLQALISQLTQEEQREIFKRFDDHKKILER